MPLGALSTKILTFLEIVAIGPFVEEAVYRGFMTKPFARKFGTAGGAAFSALLWGMTHEASWGMIGVIVLGLGFSYLYYRTQSLVPSLTIHIVKNVSAYVYLAVSDLHNALGVTVSMTVGGLLAWLVLGWLSRRLRVSPGV